VLGIISIREGESGALERAVDRFQKIHPSWHPAVAEFYLVAEQAEEAVAYVLSIDPAGPEFSTTLLPITLYLNELRSDPRLQNIRRMFGVVPPEGVEIDFEILAISG